MMIRTLANLLFFMIYLKRKYLNSPGKWEESVSNYHQYFKKVKPQLPDFLREYIRYKLHDEEVMGFQRSRDSVVLELDGYILSFLGVANFSTTGSLLGDIWLYSEILLSTREGYFIENILFEENEMSVEAKGLSLIFRPGNKCLVNDRGDKPITKRKKKGR